jgi:TolB protein
MRRLTTTAGVEDVAPAWSPDGRRIAFGRNGLKAGWHLYLMRPDGTHQRAITGRLSFATEPAWSPDGRRLAFTWMPARPPATFAQQVAIVSADGSGMHVLTHYSKFNGGTGHPAWSPDGKTILFTGGLSIREGSARDVWSVHPDGRGLRRLIANAADASWSPDGKRIAFSRRGDIYTATPAGTQIRQLTHGHYADATVPAWSPDGREIAYATMHYDKRENPIAECVTVMRADGSGRREITKRDANFWASSPDWKPARASHVLK